ncbi:glycosyltransferase family 2 protein [Gemmatirosa kalamazoonensis]|nr:glycosyltransferase family 2 protein [Gemmatirosa kalamazoonensis]
MYAPVPITVVIAARDAAAHIGRCVASAAWAAETLVVEGGSSDDTRLLALSEGATVFTHPFSTIGRQRNLAVERARHEWVLVLDAEERCTPQLATEVRDLVASALPGAPVMLGGAARDAFAVPRTSLFDGRALRGGRWRPDAPVRLFRRRLRFDEIPGADRLDTEHAAVGTLSSTLVREVDVAHDAVAERMVRAARDWALQQFTRGERASSFAVVRHFVGQFFASFVWRGGWRDGRAGLGLASLDATEMALRWSQLWALSRRDRSYAVRGGPRASEPAELRTRNAR